MRQLALLPLSGLVSRLRKDLKGASRIKKAKDKGEKDFAFLKLLIVEIWISSDVIAEHTVIFNIPEIRIRAVQVMSGVLHVHFIKKRSTRL